MPAFMSSLASEGLNYFVCKRTLSASSLALFSWRNLSWLYWEAPDLFGLESLIHHLNEMSCPLPLHVGTVL